MNVEFTKRDTTTCTGEGCDTCPKPKRWSTPEKPDCCPVLFIARNRTRIEYLLVLETFLLYTHF